MMRRASIQRSSPSSRPHDAEFGVKVRRASGKRAFGQVGEAHEILAVDAFQPALVAAVEVRQSIDRDELRGDAHHALAHLPLEHAEIASLLGKREQVLGLMLDPCAGVPIVHLFQTNIS